MKKSVTLIELLVIFSLISLLAILLSVRYRSSEIRIRDARRRSDLAQVKRALEQYYENSEINTYPPGTYDGLANRIVPKYIRTLPHDPKYPGTENDYGYGASVAFGDVEPSGFVLCANLENDNETATISSPVCTVDPGDDPGECDDKCGDPTPNELPGRKPPEGVYDRGGGDKWFQIGWD